MKKISLLLISLLVLSGCAYKDVLSINMRGKKEVSFCDYNENCDFAEQYKSVEIKNFKVDGKKVSIDLLKEEDGESYKHFLSINAKEIDNIYRVRKIFVLDEIIYVDSYSCEKEGCRTITAYKYDGALVMSFAPGMYQSNFLFGGSSLLSLFADYEVKEDEYYIKDDKLYVYATSLDESIYTINDTKIDICDEDKLKANATNYKDDNGVSHYIDTVVSVYEINYNGEYEFETPFRVYNLVMENAIFKYCVEGSN